MSNEKQPKNIDASPAANCPTMPSDWFVPPPSCDKYVSRGGNAIELLNCGEAYLPELKTAIENATDSIYIINWGFDEELDLCMLDEDRLRASLTDNSTWISTILEQKAAGDKKKNIKPVEVKILVWFNLLNQTMIEETLHENAWYDLSQTWSQKAMSGKIPNLQFVTRDINNSYKTEKTAKVGWFPTHHQKVILIDHRKSSKANGFVQGFNLFPTYFDKASHPYREKPHNQDVGLHLRGSCLIDLFHNFKESWNKALDDHPYVWKERGGCESIIESSPEIAPITFIRTYNAQILRTWTLGNENKIFDFIKNAIPRLNQFIYIEDQYFRKLEFADALVKCGKEIQKRSGEQKLLYVFVVLTPNERAKGESKNRLHMVEILGRPDVNANKQTFNEHQTDEYYKVLQENMRKKGVMVHICQLRASGTKKWFFQEKPDYPNIYVHSKLSIYDDAYLLLGSANWNRRSMNQDSELDIAVQCHDGLCSDGLGRKFRQELWLNHLNGYWQPMDKKGNPTMPANWYKQWQNLLLRNWKLYIKEEPLIMNLFPYYENIRMLRWISIIQRWGD